MTVDRCPVCLEKVTHRLVDRGRVIGRLCAGCAEQAAASFPGTIVAEPLAGAAELELLPHPDVAPPTFLGAHLIVDCRVPAGRPVTGNRTALLAELVDAGPCTCGRACDEIARRELELEALS